MKKVEKEGFNLYEVLGETMVMNNGLKAVVRFDNENKSMRDKEITAIKVHKGEKFVLVISSDFDKSGVTTKKGIVVINGLWEKARRWRKNTKHYTCDRVQVKYFEKSSGELVGYGYITKADNSEEEDVTKVALIPIFGIAVTICDKDNNEPDYVPKDEHEENTPEYSNEDNNSKAEDTKAEEKLDKYQRRFHVSNTYIQVEGVITDLERCASPKELDDWKKDLEKILNEWVDD